MYKAWKLKVISAPNPINFIQTEHALDSSTRILICTRWSEGLSPKTAAGAKQNARRVNKAESVHAIVREQLARGTILRGAQSATIFDVYRSNTKLTAHLSIPTWIDRPSVKPLLGPLGSAAPNTTVIFALMGVEALSSNTAGLVAFHQAWVQDKGLKISLLLGEHKLLWHSKSTPWNADDWIGPVVNRY